LQAEKAQYNENMEVDYISDINPEHMFNIPSTNAIVTYHNAVGIVQRYCGVFPRDQYYSPQPEYLIAEGAGGFVAELHMPKNCRPECAVLRGSFQVGQRVAKNEVAFRMVKLLHSLGELNDHLRPPKLEKTKFKSVNGLLEEKKSRKRKVREHNVTIPTPFVGNFVPNAEVFLNVITLKEDGQEAKSMNVGFLSFTRLGSLHKESLFKLNAVDQTIKINQFTQPLFLTEKNLELFRRFHFEMFRAVLRSKFDKEDKFATFCVPLLADQIQDCDLKQDPFELIDWEALDFCVNVDVNDTSFYNDGKADFEQVQEYILFDRTRYSRHYSVLALRPDLTPFTKIDDENTKFKNVAEIYKKRLKFGGEIVESKYLIHAIPLGYPYHSVVQSVQFNDVMIIPELTTVSRLQKRHIKEALKLPVLLSHFFHRLLIEDILEGVGFDKDSTGCFLTSTDLLQKAFTCPAANVAYNYERLEFYGDSFLKVFLTLHLFVNNPHRHEGFLANSRTELENNNFLRDNANELHLEKFILHNPFSRQHFVPPILEKQKTQMISDKTVADVVEANIGACYLTGGEPAASANVKFFLGDFCESDWKSYFLKWKSHQIEYPELEPFAEQTCDLVESKIDYKFKNRSILSEAFNHPSAITSGSSYERLEFLGDSILGFIAMKHIYTMSGLKLTPGAMSDLRSEMVHNQFLGAVSAWLGFPKLLNHMSPVLGMTMTTWTDKFALKLQETDTTILEDGDLDSEVLFFWNHLDTCPKAIGDLYESMIGAVFLDSGFSIAEVEKVIRKTLIEPWWHRFEPLIKGEQGLQVKHPIRILAEHVVVLKCTEFAMSLEQLVNGFFECRFTLHEQTVGVHQGETRKDAKKAAAFKAVEFFEKQKEMLNGICTCAEVVQAVEAEDKDEERDLRYKKLWKG
jgi:dsRNA-specific ribonuclease